ncbi:MAG: 5-formyltetrahydrofolate cyclo-ligase [Parcubacteria bacterium C7867-008]|nr:MAG: 5-formyltetrahydrofolate cyclo-ligase [Parcubacteria bacterium C7867-008]
MSYEEETVDGKPFYVTYTALEGEADYSHFIEVPEDHYPIPPRLDIDPWEEAERAKRASKGAFVCVLMPCTKIDATGTRTGRGGGWYDQFLSVVPTAWMRVCICDSSQFSAEALERKPWDQTVDRIGVIDQSTNTITWHETHSRGSDFDLVSL